MPQRILLERFSIARFKFVIQAEGHLGLPPYKGSTFRGGFGHALRRVVCITKGRDCAECLLYQKCVYSYIFETPPPPDSKIMRKYPKAPHPFVLIPPLEDKREYEQGEKITFGLNLIGKAIDYLPYFIFTFEELGRMGIGKDKGKFFLQEVYGLNLEEGEKLIYRGEQRKLLNLFSIQYPFRDGFDQYGSVDGREETDELTLRFLTPIRIKYNGTVGHELEFHILVRNLLRRISSLAYFHCSEDPARIDFKGLISNAEKIKINANHLRWYEWERYSSRQKTTMNLGGFIGEITYEGDFGLFMTLITLGQYTHVGKNCTFGLGKYKVLKGLKNEKR